MEKRGRELGYGEVSHAHFERLVRETWEAGREGGIYSDPATQGKRIAHIIRLAELQPDLLDEKGRAAHNLGKEKMKWVRGLLA